jgi:MarR family transcriptional regulator, lower aerobic nicotinate degradation pathway regulator
VRREPAFAPPTARTPAFRLTAKALIVREASPDDGRAQTLRLTAKGAKFLPELAALADKNELECFAHLSGDDRRVLQLSWRGFPSLA